MRIVPSLAGDVRYSVGVIDVIWWVAQGSGLLLASQVWLPVQFLG